MSDPVSGTTRFAPRPAVFVGRESEIAWLIEQLDRGERLVAVCGMRHSGASALLRRLAQRLPAGYAPLYVDAAQDSASSLADLAYQVAQRVQEQGGAHVEPPLAARFDEDAGQAWAAYLKQVHAALGARRPVLLLDHADRDSQSWVRDALQARMPTVVVAQNRERLSALLPGAPAAPPCLTLGPLDNEDAEALVKALVAPRVPIDPWAVRRTVEICSHAPYYIELFCQALLERHGYKALLTPNDVEETLEVFLDAPRPELEALWRELQPREQFVLSIFAGLRGTGGIATQYDVQKACIRTGYSLAPHDILADMSAMSRRGVLEKMGTNSFRFVLELFRIWLRRYHPPEEVLRRRLWRSAEARLAYLVGRLKAGLSRQRVLWMSLAIVAAAAVIVALQPALHRGQNNPPRVSSSPTPAGAATAAPTAATAAVQPASAATLTPLPAPTMVLPGYDLVFMSRENDDAPWQIYALNSGTGRRYRLSDTDSNERTPSWSPDGQRLVFASDRSGDREVYVLDLRDALQGVGTAVNLSQHKAPDWQPSWAPDGRRVAFSSYRDGNWEIYAVGDDGSNLVRLTEHPASDFSPDWAPDGRRLVFVSRRHGDADLFVLDVDTGETEQLTTGEQDEYDPAWSPDGEWIAFVTQLGTQSDIFVMRADGSEATNLTQSAYANDFQPTWVGYAEALIFVSYTAADGDHDLFRMRRDGRELTRLTDDRMDNLAPSWRAVSPAGP